MKITMMKAGYGDCFLIETKKNDGLPYNILVDGGTGDSYDGREKNRDYFFPYLRENKIDLMILTHIDDDHIKGIQRLFKDLLKKKHEQLRSKIMKVIYNSPYATALYLGRPYAKPQKEEQKMNNGNISASSAQNVQQLLCNLDRLGDEVIVVDDKKIKEKRNISEQGIKITFLSPTKETLEDYYKKYEIDIGKALKNKVDKAKGNISKCKIEDDYKETIEELKRNTDCEELTDYNRASIAFLLEEEVTQEMVLMLGDCDYDIVEKKLRDLGYAKNNKLKLKYVKLSHHGSIGTLKNSFLELVECNNYLISTDGKSYNHPNKKTLARIWSTNEQARFYFNYEKLINKIFIKDMEDSYRLKCEKYQFTGEKNE
ncbi:ComEC/Rec2 family competence protein [Clostridium beijerinckii]|jgi:Predicted hydrolase (metallo-beta-lactamase superfamily)|uniref:Metallo-beta-lactamase domain-containing protein n=2 Tax=Clostridium beijerinckii TaxID=1520 RepID=A0AAE2RXG3_CLOBE|nr:MBL fold metallo-hydrolase [Clostridium beijerinckii]ABR33666.1 conserved hypothetical protein [Clostridium beijerinckii NCIMB 8052]AIU01438.1 hypothetical protein Cbs_1489 [Clostridium beijerinckii ATCC 35702]MBF7812084.1 hypothetical protein [Clostridium beijerinckii]NRT25061.1 beta-lactamase superfamily II metal-dependent hydrolase [Clostridium beijerinckii]NRT67345.1 beta-lactamase superfamily II metal-dependent hydrolase [Clostridium beijerinckii]